MEGTMGRNVNIYLTDWHWTGTDVPTPQAQVNLEINWIGDDDMLHEWSGMLTFPNDLQLVPVVWVREAIEDLMLRAARVQLGIDEVAS